MYPEFSPVKSDATWRMWLNYEVLIVFTAVFFSLVYLVPDHNLLLANPIGDFLGKISYSLYLLHMPILAQVTKLDLNLEAKLLVFVALSVLCAYVSYMLIERPCANALRRYFSANKKAQADDLLLATRR